MFIFSSSENKDENKDENGQNNKQEDNLGKALRNKIVRNNTGFNKSFIGGKCN